MQTNPEKLESFKQICLAELGVELSPEETSEAASRLLDLYALLAEPLPSEIKRANRELKKTSDSRSPTEGEDQREPT